MDLGNMKQKRIEHPTTLHIQGRRLLYLTKGLINTQFVFTNKLMLLIHAY